MERYRPFGDEMLYSITLHQPWATLIVLELKTVETRHGQRSQEYVKTNGALRARPAHPPHTPDASMGSLRWHPPEPRTHGKTVFFAKNAVFAVSAVTDRPPGTWPDSPAHAISHNEEGNLTHGRSS